MVLTDVRATEPTRRVMGDTVNDPQAPTEEDVRHLFQTFTIYYQAFHRQCELEDTYIEGTRVVPTPKNMPIDPVRPATGHSIVSVGRDHVDVQNPTIIVPVPSPRAKDRSERVQKFLQGIWLHIDERVKRTAVGHEYAYGIGFLKSLWDSDQWPDGPVEEDFADEASYKEALKDFLEARNIAFPFVVKNVNPKNLIWDDSRIGMKWAIEFYRSTVGQVRAMFPEWAPKAENHQMVTFLEYWDDTWFGRMIDNEWVWGPKRHGYGHVPYEKVIPAASIDFDVGSPERRYRGILWPIHNLLDTEARLITQYESIIRMYAWRTVDFIGPRVQAENTADDYELWGSKNLVDPGVTVKPSPLVQPPQEILGQLATIQTMIEEATFPNVVRGLRPRGVSTGFAISVLAGTGRLVFGKYADGMASAMQGINRNFLELVKNKAKGRVTVHGRSMVHNFDQAIEPNDIRSLVENRVFLKAEAPEEREREALLAFRLWNGGNGIISLYEAQRRSGIVSPLEEQNQMAAEQLLALMRPKQAELAAQSINLAGQLAEAAAVTGSGLGSQALPGQAQLSRPGERSIQGARVASQAGQESVFPQNQSGISNLARQLANATGGGARVPSGERVA